MHVRTMAAYTILIGSALAASACGGSKPAANGAFFVSIGIAEPKHLIPSSTTETAGHEVIDAGDGALCTTVEQRAVIVGADRRTPLPLSRAEQDLALRHRVDWDSGPAPAAAKGPTDDARFIDASRDTLKPWEVDTHGFAAPPAFIHRFSTANGLPKTAEKMSANPCRDWGCVVRVALPPTTCGEIGRLMLTTPFS